ncbi:threonine-phosphate decarboxylase [Opitutaceae bacterium EW11]|nr:threonine-phosphate decarboxylase [Opitutaceae bacterium EW11]
MLHGHGDDVFRFAKRLRANFSSNVVADPVRLERLQRHLAARLDCVANYPEPCAESLAEHIANSENVRPEEVLVTNGACAAIHLIAQAFRQRVSCVPTPTFSEYEDACRIHEHELRFADLERFDDGTLPASELLWLCSPNNPTGHAWPAERILSRVDAAPDCLHIVDAAYEDACTLPKLRSGDVVRRKNILLIRSLTKRYSIPGLRLGYVVGPSRIIERLKNGLAPWTVNALAIEAGKFLLAETADAAAPASENREAAQRLALALREVNRCRAELRETHFFLIRWDRPCSAELKSWLVDKHGLLVRDASNFRGLDARFVRVASQGPESDRWLVDGLAEWSRRA